MRLCALIIGLLCSMPLLALPPLTMEQIMADPDWIGQHVEEVWWSADGASLHYRLNPQGSPLQETRELHLDSGEDRLSDAASGEQAVWSADAQRMLYLRDGDLFLYTRADGQHRQLTRSLNPVTRFGFQSDGRQARFRSEQRWMLVDLDSGLLTETASLRFERRPDQPESNALREAQLRLSSTLALQRAQRDEEFNEQRLRRLQREELAPPPIYLAPELQAEDSALSPDARHLLLVTRERKAELGRRGEMPLYVTESGYEETETVRTRVGRNALVPQRLWRVDLHSGEAIAIDLSTLPGVRDRIDVTASIGAQRPRPSRRPPPQQENPRDLRVVSMQWSADARHAAVMLRAVDNKDRWLVLIDTDTNTTKVLHRLQDPAWINWAFNDFGWLPDSSTLWFLSEESGYSHLHEIDVDSGRITALTRGAWEVSGVQLSHDASRYYFLANPTAAWRYELYELARGQASTPRALTALQGVEGFALSPLNQAIAVLHSGPYQPTALSLLRADSIELLVERSSSEWKSLSWPDLNIVAVPSSEAELPIWSKLYLPPDMDPQRRYPAVLFVHGAGYLQNTHRRWPAYFREQMFHHLLTQHGVVVLDMDFRASRGYGRDWRTAIYRQMGTPELQDLLDGIDWLAENHQVDPERIGVYGGSYGGFMALMALFKTPDRFVAGAALRPVTDWMHYNQTYTSNILNTPEQDPEAYARSSPIELAENLRGHLLISHGIMDDNVFYQDAVRLAQRLIELRKHRWELASYPLERHGYVQPESWYDQYRRIFELFERTLDWEAPVVAEPR